MFYDPLHTQCTRDCCGRPDTQLLEPETDESESEIQNLLFIRISLGRPFHVCSLCMHTSKPFSFNFISRPRLI